MQKIAYTLLLFIYSFSSEYIGVWQDSKGMGLILKSGGKCVIIEDSEVIVSEKDCKWDKSNKFLTYKYSNRKGVFYFKLDHNELILEQDKRSLTREKADAIMHKIK